MTRHYTPPREYPWTLFRFGQIAIVVDDECKLIALAIVHADNGEVRSDGVTLAGVESESPRDRLKREHREMKARRAA
jgi:hypothetical protein